MNEFGLKAAHATVADLGLKNVSDAHWNLSPAELVEDTIIKGEGVLTDTGALAVDTSHPHGALSAAFFHTHHYANDACLLRCSEFVRCWGNKRHATDVVGTRAFDPKPKSPA